MYLQFHNSLHKVHQNEGYKTLVFSNHYDKLFSVNKAE